jgi:hypothetical protein
MRNRGRLLMLALTSALLLSAGAGTAGAFEQTLTSAGKITFNAGGIVVACNVTLQATFVNWQELPIEGRYAGEINSMRWANCEGGIISAVLGLPWEMLNLQILGTLPNLTGILVEINDVALNFSVLGGIINCLYLGDLGLLIEIFELGGGANDFGVATLLEEYFVPFARGSGLCPEELEVSGTFNTGPLADIIII